MIQLQNLVEEKLKIEKEKEEVIALRMSLEGDLKKTEEAISHVEAKIKDAEENRVSYDNSYKNEMAIINQLEVDVGEGDLRLHEFEEKEKEKEVHIQNKNQYMTLRKRAEEEVKKYQREISSLKKDRDVMENEKGPKIDEANEKIQSYTDSLEKKEKEINAIKEGVVSDEEYNELEKIASKKKGKGFVPIYGQVCQGCNMVLPLQSVIDIRIGQKEDKFGTCPYCSRKIYYEEPSENIDGKIIEHYDEKDYLFDDTNSGAAEKTKKKKSKKDEEELNEEEYDDEILQSDDNDYFEDF